MIHDKDPFDQLPNEIKHGFQDLKVSKHLKAAGFKKKFGLPCFNLFRQVFVLLFHQKNWFRLLESDKGKEFPGKDAIYRFLNHPGYAWRRFLLFLCVSVILKFESLTSHNRVTAFIFDDSMYERNRSKKVELLARFHDHATNTFYKGFRMLAMGWSDGHSFVPIDFVLLSSLKSKINDIVEKIDKRTHGYKRRVEALLPAPQVIPAMIDRALKAGVSASYTLMDSWFTQPPLIQAICERGLHVIGMVKNDMKRYIVNGARMDLKALYAVAPRVEGKNPHILRCIRTQLSADKPVSVQIVFVRHRSKKKEWLAILSTDLTLTPQEIIRIYRMRWDILSASFCYAHLFLRNVDLTVNSLAS